MASTLLRGTRFNDRLEGVSPTIQNIQGLNGNDVIDAGAGGDNLFGGQGNDTLFGFTGRNLIIGGTGDDVVGGGQGDDALIGGQGNDSFIDSFGANTMNGGQGNDTFENLANSDTTAGADTITGGGDADRYRLALNSTVAGAVADIITDFRTGPRGDVIDFNIVFSFAFAGRDLFAAGEVRLVQDAANTLLQFETTDDAYQTVLILQGVDADDLTAANFFSNRGILTDPDMQPVG